MLHWDAWPAFARRVGRFQARVLLTVAYLVVLGPAMLIGRLFSIHLLDLSPGPGQTSWLVRRPTEATLDRLRRQF